MGRAEEETLEDPPQERAGIPVRHREGDGVLAGDGVGGPVELGERGRWSGGLKEGRNSKVVYVAGRPGEEEAAPGFTRAAEYPFLVPLKKVLREDGLELDFRVYDNGVGVARDLSILRIDIGIAPLVTLFMMHSLDAPFKIIGPAGSGGSSVLESPRARRRGGRA